MGMGVAGDGGVHDAAGEDVGEAAVIASTPVWEGTVTETARVRQVRTAGRGLAHLLR